jgi:hypothetical protein
MLQTVFNAFGLNKNTSTAIPFGSGLINYTWKIFNRNRAYILQRINHQVFTDPPAIAHNINATAKYLKKNYPDYLFISPIKSNTGDDMIFVENNGYFRLMPFVENSQTFDVVSDPKLAFEAAKQFGKFTKYLSGFDVSNLQITLQDFHNLSLRYLQFEEALKIGNP